MDSEKDMSSYNIANISADANVQEEGSPGGIYRSVEVMRIVWLSTTFILGTLGNGLVIWVFGFKMKKTVNTIWFLNLAIVDFCFCLSLGFYIPVVILNHWPFGQIPCKLTTCILDLNMAVSVFFLAVISFDRCLCVLYPIRSRSHRTLRLAVISSVMIWLLGLAVSSPSLVFTNVVHGGNISVCGSTYGNGADGSNVHSPTRQKVMILTRFVSVFLIPFTIILVCYGLISFRVRRSSRPPGSARTFKIIITVVLCFFFCWFPFHLMFLKEITGFNIKWPYGYIISHMAICLAFFNSCLNPMVYVFVGQNFKNSLRKSIPFLLENTFREACDPP
ncbi:C3a anaphylatoxin chemotactic receptor-like [Xenopus tropicalis]|nr:C3a anaphylatoxin chemotactic receptor-like [Xenopus tropicalis]